MPETLPTEESTKNLEKEKDKQNKAKLKTGKSNELPFGDEPKKED